MSVTCCRAATLPGEILPARETFEVGLQMADKQESERLAAVNDDYLAQVAGLERSLQTNAQFRGLVLVHDERIRFTKERALPAALAVEPVELHKLQAVFHLRYQQVQYTNEMALVKLADHYVKELGDLHMNREIQDSSTTLHTLDEERDRVIALPRLRRALELTKIRPASALESATGSTTASLSDGERVRRILELIRPSSESLHATIGYALRATVQEDLSKLKANKSDGASVRGRGINGQISYTPRITVSCQRGEVPTGSRLVIEYYSRAVADHARHREAVETVLLPRIEHGENYTVETKGIQLNRSEQVTTIYQVGVSRSLSGDEFYGLILHLVDPEGHVLLQRFSPQALERDLAAKPPEK